MLLALQRMRHFRMELHAVEAARLVRHRGERHAAREADRDKSRRQLIYAIAMAHPDVEQRPALRVAVIAQALEQSAGRRRSHLRVAEFAMHAGGDAATELLRHRLHAIADAEHRHTKLKHACGARGGCTSVTDSGPPERMTPRAPKARTSASLMSQG